MVRVSASRVRGWVGLRIRVRVRVRCLGYETPGYEKVRVRNVWKPSGTAA